MHCALLSLSSGLVSLVVAFLLWWQYTDEKIQKVGEQAGLFSALLGLTLAFIALASPRRRVRGIAILALAVNFLILSLTIDSIFGLIR
jgi:formate-dependent nitrite reductase membrane component NrfD